MIKAKVYNILSSLCGGRVSPDKADSRTKTPYICYTKVSEVYCDVLGGQSFAQYCFQIDIYADTALEADSIKSDAYKRIKQLSPFNVSSTGGYEEDTELYRVTLEFTFIN